MENFMVQLNGKDLDFKKMHLKKRGEELNNSMEKGRKNIEVYRLG